MTEKKKKSITAVEEERKCVIKMNGEKTNFTLSERGGRRIDRESV